MQNKLCSRPRSISPVHLYAIICKTCAKILKSMKTHMQNMQKYAQPTLLMRIRRVLELLQGLLGNQTQRRWSLFPSTWTMQRRNLPLQPTKVFFICRDGPFHAEGLDLKASWCCWTCLIPQKRAKMCRLARTLLLRQHDDQPFVNLVFARLQRQNIASSPIGPSDYTVTCQECSDDDSILRVHLVYSKNFSGRWSTARACLYKWSAPQAIASFRAHNCIDSVMLLDGTSPCKGTHSPFAIIVHYSRVLWAGGCPE